MRGRPTAHYKLWLQSTFLTLKGTADTLMVLLTTKMEDGRISGIAGVCVKASLKMKTLSLEMRESWTYVDWTSQNIPSFTFSEMVRDVMKSEWTVTSARFCTIFKIVM